MNIEEFARRIPKAELHLHLEGAVDPQTFVELAAKNGVTLPPFGDVMELYRYDNLLEFLNIYNLVSRAVVSVADFRRITYEMLARCAGGGARHVEFFFSPHAHMAYGVRYADMLDGIVGGMADAETDFGLGSLLIPAHSKALGPARGLDFVDMVLEHRRDQVIGIGTDYDELPNNPALFAGMYDKARAAGLRLTAHAGEVGPADFVRQAVEVLKVDRVDHGYHVVDDPALVADCRDRGVFFTCCPSTTLTTTVFRDFGDPGHAIRRMIDLGLKVTLNSDDPPMFGTDLGAEFALAATQMQLTADQLETCALTSVHAAWVDDTAKRQWITDWTAEIQALKAQLPADEGRR